MQEKLEVTQEELSKIQEMNAEFSKAKAAIGDVELQKHNIIKHIDALKVEFNEYEQILISKYGADSVINIQTGEVTKKQS